MVTEATLHPPVEDALQALGLLLWGLEWTQDQQGRLLRVYLTHPERPITVADCVEATHQLGATLDAAEVIPGRYRLECSSPGLAPRLFERDQYQRFVGRRCRVGLRISQDGRRRFTGRLDAVSDDTLTMTVDGETFEMPWEHVAQGHVLFEEEPS